MNKYIEQKIILILLLILIGIIAVIVIDVRCSKSFEKEVIKATKDINISEEYVSTEDEIKDEDKSTTKDELTNEDKSKIEDELTNEELEIVSGILVAESGHDFEGMMAVAETIKNRSELWNKSIKEICLAPYQFAKAKEPTEDSIAATKIIFNEERKIFKEKVLFFHADWANPYWSNEFNKVKNVGGNIFYY